MKAIGRRSLLAALLVAVLCPFSDHARKIKTSHPIRNVKADVKIHSNDQSDNTITIKTDSILFAEIVPKIRFYGFDKTISSPVESFFAVNETDLSITGMELDITYFDMKGRKLHRRQVEIDCDLPSGETKRCDVKSWDTQKSFYFYQSVKPKRQATPFNVKIELLSVSLASQLPDTK